MDLLYERLLSNLYGLDDHHKGTYSNMYRAMKYAHTNLTTKILYTSQNEREIEFRHRFTTVKHHLSVGIKLAKARLNTIAEHNDLEELENLSQELSLEFYDKIRIDEIILQMCRMFKIHKFVKY